MTPDDDNRRTDPQMTDWHWRLLARHFEGIASPEEEAWLEQWEVADPERVDLVRKLRTVWELSAVGNEDDEAAHAQSSAERLAREAWKQLAPLIDAATEPGDPETRSPETDSPESRSPETRSGPPPRPPRRRNPRRRGLLSVQVAALVGAVSVVAIVWRPITNLMTRPVEPPAMREFVADQGERVHATLGDGTEVILGPESRVRMPARFASDARTIELEGVAFFDVARDPRRPFRIRVRDALVEVLGTAFVLRAYPTDADLEVAVSEGKVALQPQAADSGVRVVLARSQVGRLEANGTVSLSDDPMALERHLAWTDGRLAFHGAPLDRVFQDLERWYGAELRVGSSELASERLTLSIEGETLEQVIDVIALSLDLRYERDGDVVVFYPGEAGR